MAAPAPAPARPTISAAAFRARAAELLEALADTDEGRAAAAVATWHRRQLALEAAA